MQIGGSSVVLRLRLQQEPHLHCRRSQQSLVEDESNSFADFRVFRPTRALRASTAGGAVLGEVFCATRFSTADCQTGQAGPMRIAIFGTGGVGGYFGGRLAQAGEDV